MNRIRLGKKRTELRYEKGKDIRISEGTRLIGQLAPIKVQAKSSSMCEAQLAKGAREKGKKGGTGHG